MFEINDDLSINMTRGDIAVFNVNALDEAEEKYLFQKGDVVRIKVTEKKACENVMFQKDFVVEEETEQVEILLTEEETKIGEVISKPTDYWYEIEINPLTNPQTIIGYDEDGAKILRLYPEGNDIETVEPTPEDIPVVDTELDLTSERPVQNQAIARAMLNLQEGLERVEATKNISSEDLEPLAAGIEENKGNIAKNTGNIEDLLAHAKNTSNPHNVTANQVSIDNSANGLSANKVQGAIDECVRTLGYTKSYNFLPPNKVAATWNGITTTPVLDDENLLQYYSVSGSRTAETYYVIYNSNNLSTVFPKGIEAGKTYKVSANSTNALIKIQIYEVIDGTYTQTALTDTEQEWTPNANTTRIEIRISVDSSASDLSDVRIYPMIIPVEIKNYSYMPYVADLKSLVCDVEKISINETFTSSTSLAVLWTYTASKKCILNASICCGHYGGRPYQVALYKNSETDPFVCINEGDEATSHKSIPLNIVLEKGEKVVLRTKYNNATTNRYFIEGYVQYLE